MASTLQSISHAIWGDPDKSERAALVKTLVTEGVSETDARKAAELSPRVLDNGGKLLLTYMLEKGAKAPHAVHALLVAEGKTEDTIRIYNETFVEPQKRKKEKRQKMIEDLMDLGIDEEEAIEVLKSTKWSWEDATALLLSKQERETKNAERAYLAEKQKYHKLTALKSNKSKVHKASTGKVTKHSRYSNNVTRNTKNRKSKKVMERSDSEDEVEDTLVGTTDEEKEPKTNTSDMSQGIMETSDEEMGYETGDSKPAATVRETRSSANTPTRKLSGLNISSSASSTQAPLSNKRPPKANKLKIFQLRKRISVLESKALHKSLGSLKGSESTIVSELKTLKTKEQFSKGPTIEFLDLLINFPSLLQAVMTALAEKAEK